MVVLIALENDSDVLEGSVGVCEKEFDIYSVISDSGGSDSKLDPSCRVLSGCCVHAQLDDSVSIVKQDILVGLVDAWVVLLHIPNKQFPDAHVGME